MTGTFHQAIFAMCLCASSALASIVDAQALEGQPNFRDLGGYETTEGLQIQEGMVFRSGELPRTTDNDLATLERLGVRTVVNFLTDGEIEYRGADRLPEGVREINLPITGDVNGIPDAANKLVEARKTGDFRSFPPEFNPLVHEELVSGTADAQYAELFKILSDESNYPVVFHCSHGIHRTGTAAALVLSALGVPWHTVREDYLLSNDYRAEEVAPRIVELNNLAKEIDMSADERNANAEAIGAFYLLEPEYIDASREAAEARFGSVDNYIRQGLKQSEAELESMRSILLK
ncbi:tyrosine-protein phosphatase [Ruegeria faecimaris]|uniref:tyrosine-protein phosphatase n=1 Tax=Ruegeria faecimaris TaxID=686389 RepID=UPI0023306FF7|nr:tyrosine-protein phosphatase [Ruegeria faecimaris]